MDKNKRPTGAGESKGREAVSTTDQSLSYQHELISKYQQEHRKVLTLFGDALSAFQQGDGKALLRKLADLQLALRRHLLDEELNLYLYLRHGYAQDRDRLEIVNRFKANSKKTSQMAFDYIATMMGRADPLGRGESELTALLRIGNILETLLMAEEQHLYPLYKKSLNPAVLAP